MCRNNFKQEDWLLNFGPKSRRKRHRFSASPCSISNNMSYNHNIQNVTSKRRRKQRLFTKDIELLLYSLGDSSYGQESTVNALEEVLIEFLTDLCHNTSQYARAHGRNKVKIDDFPFSLRNDPLKLARMEYIIKQSQRIASARREYDDKYVISQADVKPEKEVTKKKYNTSKKRKRAEAEAELDNDDDDDEGDESN